MVVLFALKAENLQMEARSGLIWIIIFICIDGGTPTLVCLRNRPGHLRLTPINTCRSTRFYRKASVQFFVYTGGFGVYTGSVSVYAGHQCSTAAHADAIPAVRFPGPGFGFNTAGFSGCPKLTARRNFLGNEHSAVDSVNSDIIKYHLCRIFRRTRMPVLSMI